MNGTPTPSPPRRADTAVRCRHCHARLSPGVDWCSLCLTPTREPEPEPGPEPGDVSRPRTRAAADDGRGDHRDRDDQDPETGTGWWVDADGNRHAERRRQGRHVADYDGPERRRRVEEANTMADELLAELAVAESHTWDHSALAVIRAHVALSDVPGGRYALAVGVGLLLLFVTVTGLTVLGMLV